MFNFFKAKMESPSDAEGEKVELVGPRHNQVKLPSETMIRAHDGVAMPIYYALIEENAEGVMDKAAEQQAKDTIRQLSALHPQEILALEGKSIEEVKISLEKLMHLGA